MAAILTNGTLTNGTIELFTPLEENPSLWGDINDLSTITKDGSERVETVLDKSGNGNHIVQTIPANKPIYTPSKIGARSALDFDGTNQFMTTPYNFTPEHHFFVVHVVDVVPLNNTADGIWSNYDGVGAMTDGEWRLCIEGEVALDRFRYMSEGADVRSGQILSIDTPYLMEGHTNSGTLTLYYNNNLIGTDTTTTTTTLSRGTAIGADVYDGGPTASRFNGGIAEIVVFPTQKTGSALTNIRNYFINKYPALGI